MASVSSTSGSSIGLYSASGAKRNGIGGLATGLNTDELIKGMTTSTRSKIAKQLQQKQTISWKQNIYQSASSKLVSFQNKYLSYTSPATNLWSESTFDRSKALAQGENSKYIDVTGTSTAAGNLSIQEIKQLAKNASRMTSSDTSSKVLETGNIDLGSKGINNMAGETIYVEYEGKQYGVTFDENFAGTNAQDVVDEINRAMKEIDVGGGLTLYDNLRAGTDTSEPIDGGGIATKWNLKSLAYGKEAKVVGGSTNAMKVLGLTAGSSSSATTPIGTIDDTKLNSTVDFKTEMAGKAMIFSYNGAKQTIKFTADELAGVGNMQQFQDLMQNKLDKAFGTKPPDGSRVKVTASNLSGTTGKLEFSTADSSSIIKFEQADGNIAGPKGAFSTKTGVSNRINQSAKLEDANFSSSRGALVSQDTYQMKVNGKIFEFGKDETVSDIVFKINNDPDAGVSIKYLDTADRFIITASKSGASGKVDIEDVDGNLADVVFGSAASSTIEVGQDAEMTISYGNGNEQVITRDTNTFALDGLSITVKGTFAKGSEPITFETKAETDELYKLITDMVKDYNELTELVNKEVTTKPNRDYAPLTEEQKAEMSEKEIENWEEKAKTGLLFGDSDLSSLATDLRFAFSFGVSGQGDVTEFGISTASSYKDNGKIIIDETKLKAALNERPDEIKKLFTAPQSDPKDVYSGGIMTRVNALGKKYAVETGANKGILVEKAGLKDSVTATTCTMAKQMADIDGMITNLKRTLKAEEDRYYRQFTKLEQVTQQMNSQSSWLTQQS